MKTGLMNMNCVGFFSQGAMEKTYCRHNNRSKTVVCARDGVSSMDKVHHI